MKSLSLFLMNKRYKPSMRSRGFLRLRIIALCIIIGGCHTRENNTDINEKGDYIPVQDYVGQGYPATEKQEAWDYIEEHREDLEEYAVEWFKKTYNLDVKVNYIHPKKGAAIATVESLLDSKLRIKIVMGLDKKNERVSGVNTSAMDAENNIMSYIVYKIYQEEFDRMGQFLKELAEEESLYGLRDECLSNIASYASFHSNYYYISTAYIDYPKTYEMFLNNPAISVNELKISFEQEREEIMKNDNIKDKSPYNPNVVVSLYSSTNDIDESKFEPIADKLIEQTYLPDFNYLIVLHPNEININVNNTNVLRYPEHGSDPRYLYINKGE